MSNREKATSELLKYIGKMSSDRKNIELYKTLLGKMSDKEFERYMSALADGSEILFFITPNLSKSKLSAERNVEIAKELGHEFYEYLELTDLETGLLHRTPVKYLVVDLPVRRQAQTLAKKIAIPKDNSRVDELTGQISGESTASLSMPELQNLYAQGLDDVVVELIKFRGGDEEGMRSLNNEIIQTGKGSTEANSGDSRAKSTDTLSIYLKGMHLDNNL